MRTRPHPATPFSAHRVARALWAAAFLALAGCGSRLPAERFVPEFEKRATAHWRVGSLQFEGLVETPDYLMARNRVLGIPDDSAALASARHAIFARVSLRQAAPNAEAGKSAPLFGSPEGIPLDGNTLRVMQTGMAPLMRLVDGKGHSVAPSAYHFERGYPPNPIHAFQFVFPDNDNGQPLDRASAELVLAEFGLNTGEVRLPCTFPAHLHLKVSP